MLRLLLCGCLALAAPALGAQDGVKEKFHEGAKAVGEAGEKVGHAVKEGAEAVKDEAKKVGEKVGHAVKEGAKATKEGVKKGVRKAGEVVHGKKATPAS